MHGTLETIKNIFKTNFRFCHNGDSLFSSFISKGKNGLIPQVESSNFL
jgi:hypothetical protein